MSENVEQNECRRKCFGLLTQRKRWGLSLGGWIILILILAVGMVAAILNVQPFLAKTARVDSRVLVVEGWVHGYAIHAAVIEFKAGHYEKIFTTGGPVVGSSYINDFDTAANVGADLLRKAGMETVQPVPAREVGRDRTYASALALRDYFRSHDLKIHAINVLTEDTHARRTQLLFQEAFGRGVAVGIISVHDPDYDAKHWWRTSEGVRNVLDEAIAYVYARFFFFPPKSN